MASVNKAIIVGNLGHDPEVRYMPSGEKVVSVSVATTEKWKDRASGEPREVTAWHRVTAFGKTADVVAEYARKGAPIYVEGSIRYQKYTDKNGVEKVATDIRADRVQLLSGRRDDDRDDGNQARAPATPPRTSPPSTPPATSNGSGFDDMDDDIPF